MNNTIKQYSFHKYGADGFVIFIQLPRDFHLDFVYWKKKCKKKIHNNYCNCVKAIRPD